MVFTKPPFQVWSLKRVKKKVLSLGNLNLYFSFKDVKIYPMFPVFN